MSDWISHKSCACFSHRFRLTIIPPTLISIYEKIVAPLLLQTAYILFLIWLSMVLKETMRKSVRLNFNVCRSLIDKYECIFVEDTALSPKAHERIACGIISIQDCGCTSDDQQCQEFILSWFYKTGPPWNCPTISPVIRESFHRAFILRDLDLHPLPSFLLISTGLIDVDLATSLFS